jgi:urease accessory protein
MHTDKDIESIPSIADLSFLQLSDSFFPTGLYTTSNGLELLFYNKNRKLTYGEISDFIKAYLVQQVGPTDCCVVGNVYNCIQKKDFMSLLELDNTYYFMRLVDETRSASTRSGIQFLRCVSAFIHNDEYFDFYSERSGLMLLYGFVVSVIGAALRLGILQHIEGQMLIDEMKPVILSTVKKNINRSLDSMWQFIPQLDIIQMHHEQMDSKMFIT